MTKRRKLVLESIFLSFGFLATQLVDISCRYWAILGLGLITYPLTALILKTDLKKIGWLVVLPPSVLYVVFASMFYFLLPQNLIIRIIITVFFWIGIYAVLLTQNIYSVASSFQTIQLLRAAQAVGFLMTLVTAFFGFNTLFSFRASVLINGTGVFLISFPLVISSLWTILLEERLSSSLISYSIIISLLTAQIGFIINFWPLTITTASLFLVSFLYVVLGISQNFFGGRLFKNTFKEYLQIGVIIFIITYFLASWR
jgi:hypothetical protein